MAKKWRQVLEKMETEHEKRVDWEETHPPITRVSKQEAVTCNLPCHGNHIPREYDHSQGVVNVFDREFQSRDGQIRT